MNIRAVGDYEIGERVMTDDLSVTYLARHTLTGASVALREFRRDVPDSNDALQQELASLVDTFHPFISCLYEVIDLGDAAYLAVEWPDLGNLRDVVQDRGPLSESQARPILIQLISALQYLQYAQDLTFRDLRAENVRLDAKMNIKLGHFVRGDSVPAPELLMEQGPTAANAPPLLRIFEAISLTSNPAGKDFSTECLNAATKVFRPLRSSVKRASVKEEEELPSDGEEKINERRVPARFHDDGSRLLSNFAVVLEQEIHIP
jgi:serine/threonine protein kinase